MVLPSGPEVLHLLCLFFLEAGEGERWITLLYPYDMALGVPSALQVLAPQRVHFGILLGLLGMTTPSNCSSLVAGQTSWGLSMS
jgi:hypothetical protein